MYHPYKLIRYLADIEQETDKTKFHDLRFKIIDALDSMMSEISEEDRYSSLTRDVMLSYIGLETLAVISNFVDNKVLFYELIKDFHKAEKKKFYDYLEDREKEAEQEESNERT